jgi:hypothetical protein
VALVDDLRAARDNLGAIVKAQTEAWLAAGCPPTFSADGESYSWNEWLKAKSDEIEALTKAIQSVSSPFIVRSRGRA